MASVPTIRMKKNTAVIIVNESEREAWEKNGFVAVTVEQEAAAAAKAKADAEEKAAAEEAAAAAKAKADAETSDESAELKRKPGKK